MLFNSIEFGIFLPIVFLLYWLVLRNSIRWQNVLLLVASYLFYGWWDWRFLSLIFISSTVDYLLGLSLERTESLGQRRLLLVLSLTANLGFLGFFKYYNFFVDSLVSSFGAMGITIHAKSLNIILPVGISFYTFQTLSYTIDIYRRQITPTKDILSFFTFVSFFPQLVAGPIERARNLLPQFERSRVFDYDKARDGARQILWGLAKKIIVADTCASNVDLIFGNYHIFGGSVLFLGAFFFAFQIYCDFSGYSDIAIGTSKLFGFDLMRNFSYPYFSRNVGEFWRRWHISLSTWFRDYVYIPLGGSSQKKSTRIRNIIITFTVSGLWHGANWTFVAWGFLNALYYLPAMLVGNKDKVSETVAQGRLLPSIPEVLKMGLTFFLTLVAWVFFRSKSISDAVRYIQIMFSKTLFSNPLGMLRGRGITSTLIDGMAAIMVLLLVEWLQREKQHPLQIDKCPRVLRWSIYWVLGFLTLLYFGDEQTFIYFQF